METERIALSQRERDRLRVLHEVKQKQITQVEAAKRLKISDRHIRRLLLRLGEHGDRAVIHGLRGRRSNRRLAARLELKILSRVRQRYADFGPTLAAEHLAPEGLPVSREPRDAVDDLGGAGNTYIVRPSAAIVFAFSLVLASLLAPVTHVHAAEHEADKAGHGSAVVHSPLSAHASRHSANASVSADDDDASGSTQLDIFNFSTPVPISIPDIPTIGFRLPEIREAFGRITVPTVRAHGPPLRSSPGLRAPPASSPA